MSLRPGGAPLTVPAGAGPAVTLLVGEGARVGRLLVRWSVQCPRDERWALVRVGQAEPTPGWPLSSALEVVDFAGGCACCVAASAFSMAMLRLLRAAPWDRIFVSLPLSAEPAKVSDALWSGPLGTHLRGIETVAVLADPAAALSSPGLDAARAADLLLFEARPALDPAGVRALRECLGREDDGADPLIHGVEGDGPDWRRVRAWLEALRDPSRGRWLGDHRWVWPAATVFDRRRIEAALRAMSLDPAVIESRAVIRTRRDGYAWHADADGVRWTPTASRRESRIECRIGREPPFDAPRYARLWEQALDDQAPRAVRD